MSKREVPKLNRDKFTAWKSLMKLHLGGIGDNVQSYTTVEHIDPIGTPTIEDMRKKKEYNQAMLEISSTLSYAEFDDIEGLDSAKKMWDSLKTIYGGDKNAHRSKSKSLRGKFDDMRMEEGETVAQYVARIKKLLVQ